MGYFKTEFCVSHIRYILLYYIVYKNATKIIRKNPKFVLFFSKNNAPLKAVRYILCRHHGNSIYFITKCVLVKIFLVIYSKYAVSFYPSVTPPRAQTRITLPITSFKCGAQQKTSGISARHSVLFISQNSRLRLRFQQGMHRYSTYRAHPQLRPLQILPQLHLPHRFQTVGHRPPAQRGLHHSAEG